MTSAVLCSDFLEPNLVAVGTMNKELKIFDYRVPTTTSAALSNTFHTSTVLCLKSPYSVTSGSLSGENLFSNSTSSLDFSDANSLTSNMGDVCLNEAPEPTSDIPPPSQNVAFYSGGKDGILAAWDLRRFDRPLAQHKVICNKLSTYYISVYVVPFSN